MADTTSTSTVPSFDDLMKTINALSPNDLDVQLKAELIKKLTKAQNQPTSIKRIGRLAKVLRFVSKNYDELPKDLSADVAHYAIAEADKEGASL